MRIKDEYMINLIAKGERMDDRKLDEYRKIIIEKDVVYKADGSAKVCIGDTQVLAGVKMSVGAPFPDKPNEGVLIVNAEFSPLASPEFETGPPKEDAIELARVVDRGIRESGAIDTEKLCITEGEKVWIINLDIHTLNHSGNLIDASALAAIQALLCTKIPEYDGEKINYEKKIKSLPVRFKPVVVSVAKIADKLVVDPTLEEERVMGTKLIIATKDNGNICALQKMGSEPLDMNEIETAFKIALEKGKILRKLLS